MKKMHMAGLVLAMAVLFALPTMASEVTLMTGNFDVMLDGTGTPMLPIAEYPHNTGVGAPDYFTQYPLAPQGANMWNEWWQVPGGYTVNDPMTLTKIEFAGLNLLSLIGGTPVGAVYFNWSVAGYTDPVQPSASQEAFINRQLAINVVNSDVHDVVMYLPYTPEWVSVDVMGQNVWLNGQILVKQVQTPEPVSMIMLGCLGAGMAAARKLRRK